MTAYNRLLVQKQGKKKMDEAPGWLLSLIQAVRVRLTLPGTDKWAGMHFLVQKIEGEDAFEVCIYPRPIRVENKDEAYDEFCDQEEYVAYPRFTVDVTSILNLLDSVSAVSFTGNDPRPFMGLEGDYVSVVGVYHGQPVSLRIYSRCPDEDAEALHAILADAHGWDEDDDDEPRGWSPEDDLND